KTSPPKPVQLFNVPLALYNFAAQLSFLKSYSTAPAATAAPEHSLFVDPTMDFAKFGKPVVAINEPDLNAGIERGSPLLDPRPIFKKCGFYREAMRNHGANNDQPQWNLAILGTTFMESGNAFAHEISSEHVAYTEADTQAMYDRKVAEQSAGG